MGRILGIDYGDRRIGLALSDPTGIIASPHKVIEYDSIKAAVREIADLCRDQDVSQIVVGMPLNMDGSKGPRAELTDDFIERLAKATPVPIRAWDERLSTSTAQAALIEAGMRRDKRRKVVDKIAAQVILQHYLDSLG